MQSANLKPLRVQQITGGEFYRFQMLESIAFRFTEGLIEVFEYHIALVPLISPMRFTPYTPLRSPDSRLGLRYTHAMTRESA